MTLYDSDTIAALSTGRLVRRNMFWVTAADSTEFGFWDGADNISVSVVDGRVRTPVTRSFVGGGSLLSLDAIPWVVGTSVQTIQVKLSQIHADVQNMIRAKDVRHRWAEVHRALFDPQTGLVVSTPFPRFVGRVDGAPLLTPAAGQEGSVTIAVVSSAVDLTRTNPALKSDAQQRLRSGDTFRQYSDLAAAVEVAWGEKVSKTKKNTVSA